MFNKKYCKIVEVNIPFYNYNKAPFDKLSIASLFLGTILLTVIVIVIIIVVFVVGVPLQLQMN